MEFFKILLTILVGGYLLTVILMSLFQSKLIYFPVKDLYSSPENIGLPYEDVTLNSRDNAKIHGWFIPRKDATTTLLFFHGNGGNISHRLESLQLFHRLNLNVLIVDYRGYGSSEGAPSEENTYEDGVLAWEFLIKNKSIKPEDIIIFGRSLGGSIAANLASRVEHKGVILESTITSAPDMAGDVYPFVPKFLIRFKYETKRYITNIKSPILIIHSKDDEIVPYKHGKKLFELANEPKRFLDIKGSHNRGFLESENYFDGLKSFLDDI